MARRFRLKLQLKNITFTLWQSNFIQWWMVASFLQLTFKYLRTLFGNWEIFRKCCYKSQLQLWNSYSLFFGIGLHIKISMIVCACWTLLQKNWNKNVDKKWGNLYNWSYAIQQLRSSATEQHSFRYYWFHHFHWWIHNMLYTTVRCTKHFHHDTNTWTLL